mmetsp:Transcript_12692/g.22643  ORF Transcript_12692/g.22643 Transcript_12692/m.22643 type:complete len:222 (-) Transcript_12692:1848-2513(-)
MTAVLASLSPFKIPWIRSRPIASKKRSASAKMNSRGRRMRARAMPSFKMAARLSACPLPLPTRVPYPSGRFRISSCNPTAVQTDRISSARTTAQGRARATLSSMVVRNTAHVSAETKDTRERRTRTSSATAKSNSAQDQGNNSDGCRGDWEDGGGMQWEVEEVVIVATVSATIITDSVTAAVAAAVDLLDFWPPTGKPKIRSLAEHSARRAEEAGTSWEGN